MDNSSKEKRLFEINSAIRDLDSKFAQLSAERKSLGFFSGDAKRQMDFQIASLRPKYLELEAELRDLSAPQQPKYLWRVIYYDEANNRVLAITRDVITKMLYHRPGGTITWEGCTLRRWLNSKFYSSLPVHISARVQEATNQNPDNGGKSGGSPTQDKVFLLSIDEARAYFSSDAGRVAKYDGSDNSWWLRSPGINPCSAAVVSNSGGIYDGGDDVGQANYGVRPALWLNL